MTVDARHEGFAAKIAAFVARETGRDVAAVRVSTLKRLAGGASRELWSVVLDLDAAGAAPAEHLDLVLRRDPPGRTGESDRGLEMRLLRAAQEAGVLVPRVRFGSNDAGVLGSPFFLMDRVSGEALPRRLLRDAEFEHTRRGLARELGALLAGIHRIDPNRPELAGLTRPPAGVSPARAAVEVTAQSARALALEPHPVLELAERWLLERAPARDRRTVVHGDFRVGNVMFDQNGVRAVLDWELAHVGDPMEDLGWLCGRTWRFGNDHLPVGGVGTREDLCEAYEQAGGEPVDPKVLRFWEAAGAFRVAVVWLQQSRVFLAGLVKSVELASLGRRTAEAEEELLRLMEEEP